MPTAERLDSWKAIAHYLGRDVRTVQRWEAREGLPVHRLHHLKRGSVYAYVHEIDAWWLGRGDALEAEAAPAGPPAERPAKVPRAAWVLGAALLLGALAAAAWLATRQAQRPVRSIAVLPLANLSGDPAQEYFADGITESLITDLAQLRGLRVISRTSVMRYKGARPTSLRQVAGELGVDAIVEGSAVRSGNRVRVTAQLVRASTEEHLWAQVYEREAGDVLLLQGELARAIVSAVEVALSPRETARLQAGRRIDAGAHELYLRGRSLWARREREALWEAVRSFDEAIARDASYAAAHAGLADAYVTLGASGYGLLEPAEAARRAQAAARRALELDPDLGSAHAALGMVHLQFEWDWQAAEAALRRAVALSPGYASGHQWLARCLGAQGRGEEALSEARLAAELDPLASVIRNNLALQYLYLGRTDDAVRTAREALGAEPDFLPAHTTLGHAFMAKGLFEEALGEHRRALELSGGATWHRSHLGHVYGRAGRGAEARAVLAELEAAARERPVPACQRALVHAGLGQLDPAFRELERAYTAREDFLLWLKVHPLFDPLRADPRFPALLRRVGLP